MKLTVSSSCPRVVAPLAPARRTFDTSTAASWDAAGEVVLPTRRSTGGSPFIAQYLAQEFFGSDGQPPCWRERDRAYRLTGNPSITPRLSLDI